MRRVTLIGSIVLIAAVIVGIPTLLADGDEGDDDRITHPFDRERVPITEVCTALPTFEPRAIEEFVVEARRLAPRAHATIGWYLEASSTQGKNRLTIDLRKSGFRVGSFPIYSDSWAVQADRRVELTARAVRRQRQRLDAASTAKGKRFVLQVAYPPDGCIDKDG